MFISIVRDRLIVASIYYQRVDTNWDIIDREGYFWQCLSSKFYNYWFLMHRFCFNEVCNRLDFYIKYMPD